LWASGARPGIEGRVRERARVRLEWDDVWDGTVVPAKVVRGPTVSARRSKTRRTGCHRGALFFCCRSSFCAERARARARAALHVESASLIHFGLLSSASPPEKRAIASKMIARVLFFLSFLPRFHSFFLSRSSPLSSMDRRSRDLSGSFPSLLPHAASEYYHPARARIGFYD